MRKKTKILHFLNEVSPTSIPFEVAKNLDHDLFDVLVFSFYDKQEDIHKRNKSSKIKLVGLGARFAADIIAISRLYLLLKKYNFDIMHVHHNLSGFWGRILGKITGVPIIINTEHNDHKGFNRLGRIINALTLGLSDVIVCNSKNTLRSFSFFENLITENIRKEIVYNGVDIDKIDKNKKEKKMRDRYNLHKYDFIIGNVGRLAKQKDQKTIILAFKEILKKNSRAKLVIVGGGGMKKELKDVVLKNKLVDRVIFTGLLNREETYQLLHLFDVFVMSSLWEGFCNAVVEAMVAKKAMVVTRINPFPEVIGDNVLYIPPKNYKALAEKIITIMENPSLEIKNIQKRRRRAEEKFSLRGNVNRYQKIYFNLLNEKKKF